MRLSLVILALLLSVNPAFAQQYKNKLCAKRAVDVRQSIITDDPLSTIQAFPVSQRRVIATLKQNQCRWMAESKANYHYDDGHQWVLLYVNPKLTGWAISDQFAVYQVEVDSN